MIVLCIIFILYALWLAAIGLGMHRNPVYKPQPVSKKLKFSLIIPFKNEAANLARLLASLNRLNYPKNYFEIIMIDDHSSDRSNNFIHPYKNINLLKNKGIGKKKALKTGIDQAQFDWIVTTDADCELPVNFLKTLNGFIQQQPTEMVLGPVCYQENTTFLGQFQQFEFLSLQAVTIAAAYWHKPFLANGANLSFKKSCFYKVGGYQGNTEIASGDDVFLLEKFKKQFPGKIHFLKSQSALIKTKSPDSWHEMIQQKIRWAGKSKFQKGMLSKWTGLLMLLINLSLIYSCFNLTHAWCFVTGKLLIDALFMLTVVSFYRVHINWVYYIPAFFLYPFYFTGIALLSIKGHYTWKNENYQTTKIRK